MFLTNSLDKVTCRHDENIFAMLQFVKLSQKSIDNLRSIEQCSVIGTF